MPRTSFFTGVCIFRMGVQQMWTLWDTASASGAAQDQLMDFVCLCYFKLGANVEDPMATMMASAHRANDQGGAPPRATYSYHWICRGRAGALVTPVDP